jgi:hypothetical protein
MLTPKEYEEIKEFNCHKYKTRWNFREIIIPALSFDEQGKRSQSYYGAISTKNEEMYLDNIIRWYEEQEREATLENGDIVKYVRKDEDDDDLEPEWIFSPHLCWNRIPEEFTNQLKECECMWDYYGKIITDENYADPKEGWRNNFFIMKASAEWKFRIDPEFGIAEGFWKPFSPPKPKERYTIIEGEKIFSKNELKIITSEEKFIERFNSRKPLTQKELFDKFSTKYETIFKWLLVGVNKREAFWDVLKRDASKNLLDCYQIRLEEIVESFTGSTKKFWRHQKGIAARKK